MPYQPLPTSAKVESLPKDLRNVAERLLRERLGIKDEPDVISQQFSWGEHPMNSRMTDPAYFSHNINMCRYRLELRYLGVKDPGRPIYPQQYQMSYASTSNYYGYSEQPPRFLEVAVQEGCDVSYLVGKVHSEVAALEDKYNVRIEVRGI